MNAPLTKSEASSNSARAEFELAVQRYTFESQAAEIGWLNDYTAGIGGVSSLPSSAIFKDTPYNRLIWQLHRRGQELLWTLQRLRSALRAALSPGSVVPTDRPLWDGAAIEAPRVPRVLIDVSRTSLHGAHTGVQRVARNVAQSVTSTGEGIPFIVNGTTLRSYYRGLDIDRIELVDTDTIFLLDLPLPDKLEAILEIARKRNVKIVALIYDLIPIRYPGLVTSQFSEYLTGIVDNIIRNVDAVIGISKTVALDVADYAETFGRAQPLRIGWSHLGADFARADDVPRSFPWAGKPMFLAVGTIEPRKAWGRAIDAIEILWSQGYDAHLAIVGRYGWSSRYLQSRIETHPEYRKRLHWFSNADDALLASLYRGAKAVVFPSVVEGFGLPLIEAKHYGAPVIASDIPIFREIGGEAIDYFPALDSEGLAESMKRALADGYTQPDIASLSWQEAGSAMTDLVRALALNAPHERRVR